MPVVGAIGRQRRGMLWSRVRDKRIDLQVQITFFALWLPLGCVRPCRIRFLRATASLCISSRAENTSVIRPLRARARNSSNRSWCSMHLGGVAAAELVPSTRIMPKPAAQLGAGRDVLHPFVKSKGLLGDCARPEPVDENANAVIGSRRFISPLQPDIVVPDLVCSSERSVGPSAGWHDRSLR